MDTINDVYDFILLKITNDESRIQSRRRKRQTRSDLHLNSHFGQEIRNGTGLNPHKNRSNSLAMVNVSYPLNNNSKRPSNETLLSSQLNSRRQSKVALNADEEV